MTEYLVLVIGASAVVTFGGFMLYGGEMNKPSKTALSMILLATVIMPIASALGNVGSISAEDVIGDYADGDAVEDVYGQTAEAAFCEGVRKMVCDEFLMEEEDVSVRCFGFSLAEMRADKIKIILSGGAVYKDSRAIAARIREAGLGECEVELEF